MKTSGIHYNEVPFAYCETVVSWSKMDIPLNTPDPSILRARTSEQIIKI